MISTITYTLYNTVKQELIIDYNFSFKLFLLFIYQIQLKFLDDYIRNNIFLD
jgi:hypothetical protein